MTPEPSPPTIVLTGFMGTGKSTVGRLLAERLDVPFVDTDELIETEYGPIPGIFAARGEEGFREIERQVARDLAGGEGLVVATGGRFMLDPANRDALADRARVFCLTADAEEILRRVLDHDTERPLLAGTDPAGRIAGLLEERAEGYAAFEQVPTTDRAPEEIVDDIIARLEAPG